MGFNATSGRLMDLAEAEAASVAAAAAADAGRG